MRLFKKNGDLHSWLKQQKIKGQTIGFAPTMGALHNGHLSLIEASKKDNSITVSSIFVNPTQFNDPGDFEKYPITLEKDIELLEKAGCDILFLPSTPEIYPQPPPVNEHYDIGYLETILEGKYRPGHFQGVCKVVKRLLDIVQPGNLYLGQKDYQQCMVITKLIEIMGLKRVIKVNICPTLREADGLAMSSRNMRLNKSEREKAPAIYRALTGIRHGLQKGNVQSIKTTAWQILIEHGFKPDYIEIADAVNLQPVNDWDGRQKLVAVTAAFLNEVRLIDNLLLNE